MNRPLLAIVAPFGTRTLAERTKTEAAILGAAQRGYCPIFLPYVLREVLFENVPSDREVGLECSVSLVQRCDAVLVVGHRKTEGMARELAAIGPEVPVYQWPDLPEASL